jgi:hypothetical protein
MLGIASLLPIIRLMVTSKKQKSSPSSESVPAKTLVKRRSPPSLGRAEKSSEPASESHDQLPSLRFVHSQALRKQTLKVLTSLEQAEAPGEHRTALADLVVELMTAGMDFYFLAPLKQAKAGFVIQQSANLGMVGVQQLMGGVIRNIIGRMEEPALLSVSGSIRSMMR